MVRGQLRLHFRDKGRQAREGEGPQEPSLLLPSRGVGGAHHLCFVRCWVGVSMGGAAISMKTWGPLRPVGKVGIGSQEGVSGKTPEGPPSSGQAEMLPGEPTAGVWQVGGQDVGAESGRPPVDSTPRLLSGITVHPCPSGMSRGLGGPERLGAGV